MPFEIYNGRDWVGADQFGSGSFGLNCRVQEGFAVEIVEVLAKKKPASGCRHRLFVTGTRRLVQESLKAGAQGV